MPLLALLSPTLLALSLGSLSVLGQQQWNTSNDRSDAAALVTLPITRFGLPGFDFTIEDAVRSDQNRVNWLYETAIERGNDELFGPSDDSAVAGGNATAGVLRSRASTSDTNLANVVSVYVAYVGIGTPATSYGLVVDTGSANAWIRSPTRRGVTYQRTPPSHLTGNKVHVTYASGYFRGDEYLDDLQLGSVSVHQQSITVATERRGFDAYDGILGIGPTELNRNTNEQHKGLTSTAVDTMYMQRTIDDYTYGIWFSPVRRGRTSPGELSFGRSNPGRYQGPLRFSPLSTKPLANQYWAVDASFSYNGRALMPATPTVLDSGTTLIVLNSDAFQQYKAATGATEDPKTGMLRIPEDYYKYIKNLDIWIQGVGKLILTPNAQIWPRTYAGAAGGQRGYIYLAIADSQRPDSGVVLGMVFLERYYTYYDGRQHRIGFAATDNTFSETN